MGTGPAPRRGRRTVRATALSLAARLLAALVVFAVAAQRLAAQGLPAAQPPGGPPELRHFHHTRWAYPDGINPGGVNDGLVRSADGYLWFSHPLGLVRFDGVRFVPVDGRSDPAFLAQRATDRALTFYVTEAAYPAHHGPMWLYSTDGALRAYEDGRFRVVRPAPVARVTYKNIYRDGAGRLWGKLDSAGHTYIRRWRDRLPPGPPWPASIPAGDVASAVPDTADGLWVGTSTGELWHVTPRGARRYAVPPRADLQPAERGVVPLLHGRDGTLWVKHHILYRIRDGRWLPAELVPGGERESGTFTLAEAPDGSVYVATNGRGLARWRAGGVEWQDLSDPATARVVFGLHVDADGTVWTTTERGLERFRPPAFVTLDRGDGMPADPPYEIAPDDSGGIWVSYRHPSRLIRLTAGVVRGASGPVTKWQAPLPRGVNFQMLAADGAGVWIAAPNRDLFYVSRHGVRRIGPAPGMPQRRIVAGVRGDDGSLWVLHLFNTGVGRVRQGRYAPVRLPGTDSARAEIAGDATGSFVVAALEDDRAAYMLGGSGTVRRLDSRTPLRRGVILVTVEGIDTVWAATRDLRTMVRISGGRATEVPLPEMVLPPRGGPGRFVIAAGALWFGSPAGVGRISLAALHAAADRGSLGPAPQRFSTADGLRLAALVFPTRTHLARAPDGRVWLSTPAGLAVVDPAAIPVNRNPPIALVEEVTVAGQPIRRDTIPPSGALRLPPQPARVTIHYTSTSMRMSERVRLAYRLDGVDRDWTDGTAARAATYTELGPGRYRFRVRAWNEDGVPSAGEATLALQVLPAWYQTWWAMAVGAAGVAGAGAAAAAGVGRARRRRAELAVQAAIAERVRVARELHDTLLSDMAGVAMRLDGLALRPGGGARDGDAVTAALGEVRDQVRHTLVETRRAVTAMRDTADDLVPLWAQLHSAACRIFAGTDVEVRVEHGGRARQLPPDVRTEVTRIATEAMTNARKHAGCRALAVSCEFRGGQLRVRVRDDGRGFAPAATPPDGHFGLAGMRERAAAIDARVTVESAPGRGTTVVLVLPVPRGG